MLLQVQAWSHEKQASGTSKGTLTGPRPSLELSGPLKDAQRKEMAFILTHSKALLCPRHSHANDRTFLAGTEVPTRCCQCEERRETHAHTSEGCWGGTLHL